MDAQVLIVLLATLSMLVLARRRPLPHPVAVRVDDRRTPTR
ncbi:MAG TPA: hypothetical protein VGL99_10550 [Chloroflexota bacterium]|jgi:hypothetical protein